MVLRGGSILFDIDGTLVDSTAVVERSWRAEDRWRGSCGGARDSHQGYLGEVLLGEVSLGCGVSNG